MVTTAIGQEPSVAIDSFRADGAFDKRARSADLGSAEQQANEPRSTRIVRLIVDTVDCCVARPL